MITCSPVSPEDFDELVALRIAAMKPSLERIGRFDPERARERLRNSFYPEHTQFILVNGERVGFYTFRPVELGLRLEHLYIHPDAQSRGAGTGVLCRLLNQADALRLPVFLSALRDSASNQFYRRHGFVLISEDEWDMSYRREPLVG